MVHLGIIGTGGMANAQAKAFRKLKNVKLVAACDIDENRVSDFCKEHKIASAYTDVDKFLNHPKMDAVTNVTPDPFHAPISLKAIAKKKHILCEKPLAENASDATKMTRAAKRAGIINMVQFSYRRSAALQRAHKMITSGQLGRIVHFEARYYQSWISSNIWGDWRKTPAWLWRQSSKHGSKGVLGDVGVHIVDFATFPIDSQVKKVNCQLKTFNNIKGKKHDGYTLDANDSAFIRCELANGAVGIIQTSRWATGYANNLHLEVFGEKGALKIDLDHSYDDFEVCTGKDIHKAEWKTIKCKPAPDNFARFIKSIRTGKNDQPDFAKGTEIQKVLDACFDSDRSGKTVSVR